MSKTRNIIHLVFATKNRRPTINPLDGPQLYKYIAGIIQNSGSRPIEINGTRDHIHLLFELHPTIALASLVREIKASSTKWIRANHIFSNFDAWAEGYYAASLSATHETPCREYIMNQAEHHKQVVFEVEIESWARKNGIEYNPLDW